MAVSNKELISKADLALSEITANSGKLNPDQTTRFIRKLIDSPTVLNAVRTVAMPSPDMKINKIGFASRILMPATSATPLDADTSATNRRSKPTLSQVTLSTKEIIAEVRLPYEVLEDSIERGTLGGGFQESPGGLHATLVDLIGERAALDLEELVVKGDSASGDAYLALTDGYLKRMTSHTVSIGAGYTKDTIKAAIKAMPVKYRRNLGALVNFVPVDAETDLRDQYANRQTGLGDSMVQGNIPLYVFGTPVKSAAMLASPSGFFTHPQNLIFGIQRNLMMEFDKDIRARQYIIVLTCRVAVQIEEEDACVKYVA